ncbi:MAG: hypothetical protein ACRDRL_10520, partial [Sciscionella sp.]
SGTAAGGATTPLTLNGVLAFTGSHITLEIVCALAALALGLLLWWRSNRRRDSTLSAEQGDVVQ